MQQIHAQRCTWGPVAAAAPATHESASAKDFFVHIASCCCLRDGGRPPRLRQKKGKKV